MALLLLGAQRWLTFAGFNIQPSEFAKISLILVLASILDQKRFGGLSHLTKPLLVSILPWILVFIQPDLGTTMLLLIVTSFMFFMSDIKFRSAVLGVLTLFLYFSCF